MAGPTTTQSFAALSEIIGIGIRISVLIQAPVADALHELDHMTSPGNNWFNTQISTLDQKVSDSREPVKIKFTRLVFPYLPVPQGLVLKILPESYNPG